MFSPVLLRHSVAVVIASSTLASMGFIGSRPLHAPALSACAADADAGERGSAGRDCARHRHPESYMEMAGAAAQWQMRLGASPPGALRMAVQQKSAMKSLQAQVSNAGGSWQQYGAAPLIANDPNYPFVSTDGLAGLSGRVDSFAYDAASNRVFALPGNGGLWMSSDWNGAGGPSWTPIGDQLPTTNNGAVAWTTAGGGTLVVLSGNSDFLGSPSYGGLGAYWSADLGQTWHHALGIPDGLFGFELAVDQAHPSVIYAATSRGLFRSSDAGHSFSNVKLPTWALDPQGNKIDCAGVESLGPCQFASVVTSVAVQAPGGTPKADGGKVLAAVGFQLGNANAFHDGTVRSPGNGLYRSNDGTPGSFSLLQVSAPDTNVPAGFAPANRIGRVAFGVASGADQDHNYVYAVVQDAILMNGGLPGIDVNPADLGAPALPVGSVPTVFNGLYVSPDFGDTWTRAADAAELQNPASGSALVPINQATGYGPGVQAWYNLWVLPDPTKTAQGVPSRLFFGLEEVWSSVSSVVPQNGTLQSGPADYHVIGTYRCLLSPSGLASGAPAACPGANPSTATTTTHPDQHARLIVPDGQGGMALFVGHDGGVNIQHVAAGSEPDNAGWGGGANTGLNTTLPYNLAVAKDGTAWFGLQDNGSGKVDPATGKMFMTYGGDGFYVAVDPDNSKIAYEEVTNGDISVTTDGGTSWTDMNPNLTNPSFANPFAMDPTDAKHLIAGGQNIMETVDGPATCTTDPTNSTTVSCTWVPVFDLGTNPAPDSSIHITSALDVSGANAYVAFCGRCSGFGRPDLGVHAGIATNVGGDKPAKKASADGWHFATARGLPNRHINWLKIDPADPRTIYVAIGGYSSGDLAPPGTYLDNTRNVGRGHVYKSVDAGENFSDISGNLPDISALSLTLYNGGSQVIVGTEIGAFISSDASGTQWSPLGYGLPNVPVTTLTTQPGKEQVVLAATYGRGLWSIVPAVGGGGGGGGGGNGGGTPSALGSGEGGGALAPALLVLLGAAGLLRRRRRP